MGCDIHIVLEKWWNEGLEWVGVNPNKLPDNRHYARFGRLANVRCPGPDAKGLPEDASSLAQMEHGAWGIDAHSASWNSLKEFIEICMETEDDKNIRFCDNPEEPNHVDPYSHYFGLWIDSEKDVEEYRVVYWFDN